MTERRGRFSILGVLLGAFFVTSVLGVGLALHLGLDTAYDNTRSLWITMTHADLKDAQNAMRARIERMQRRNIWVAREVANGDLSPDNVAVWDNTLAALVTNESDVTAIGLLTPDGRFRGYDPRSDKPVSGKADPEEDIIARSLIAYGPGQSITQFPRWNSLVNQVVISEMIPLFQSGQYIGSLVQLVSLGDFSRDLKPDPTEAGRTPFVIVNDHVIAHPSLSDWHQLHPPENPGTNDVLGVLPRIDGLADPVLARMDQWQTFDFDDSGPSSDGTSGSQTAALETADGYHVIITRQFEESASLPVLMGMHFDPTVFTREWERLKLATLIGTAIMVLAVILAILIAHYFTRPLKRFSAATRQLETGILDDLPILPGSHIIEFNDASRSFNNMAITLRDRERIGRLFGKFLPTAIAQQLLASDDDTGNVQSRQCEASILFVDLVGFTTLSEKIAPQRIVTILNAYFAKATAIIEENGGIITQFQGDAILAVFNAFDDVPDHADAAVRTAIALQKLVHNDLFDGEELRCRCGINTGLLVAGNVGAPDRLTFTVHGDAVNSAARLEAKNKELGTRILIASTTFDQLSDPSQARLADEILLRGRSETTAVYTIPIDGID
ncbi:adenylate/guanylate cyclase domain-containing protein [Thalassospira australica]|uniref:adenylate/guanylate cyclase domain-containing protein n=1 Tax=Thalassospira australica TaxID=1528106 RepID=UPI00384B3907